MRILCATIILIWVAIPAAAEVCNKPQSGQFATTTLCASTALDADGKPLPAGESFARPDDGVPWLFEKPRSGNAPVLTLKFETAPLIRTLLVENGWAPAENSGFDRFMEFGRAREVLLETSNGYKRKLVLRDTPREQKILLPRPMKPLWVRLTVLSTHAPAKPLAAIRAFYANMEELGAR